MPIVNEPYEYIIAHVPVAGDTGRGQYAAFARYVCSVCRDHPLTGSGYTVPYTACENQCEHCDRRGYVDERLTLSFYSAADAADALACYFKKKGL